VRVYWYLDSIFSLGFILITGAYDSGYSLIDSILANTTHIKNVQIYFYNPGHCMEFIHICFHLEISHNFQQFQIFIPIPFTNANSRMFRR